MNLKLDQVIASLSPQPTGHCSLGSHGRSTGHSGLTGRTGAQPVGVLLLPVRNRTNENRGTLVSAPRVKSADTRSHRGPHSKLSGAAWGPWATAGTSLASGAQQGPEWNTDGTMGRVPRTQQTRSRRRVAWKQRLLPGGRSSRRIWAAR